MPQNTPKSQENRVFDNLRGALQFILDSLRHGGRDAVQMRRERLVCITQNQPPEGKREPDTEGLEMMERGDITLDLKNPENAGKFQEVLNVLLITVGYIPGLDIENIDIEKVRDDPQTLFDWADSLKCLLESNIDYKGALATINTPSMLIVLIVGENSQDFCLLNLDKITLKMTFKFENGSGETET